MTEGSRGWHYSLSGGQPVYPTTGASSPQTTEAPKRCRYIYVLGVMAAAIIIGVAFWQEAHGVPLEVQYRTAFMLAMLWMLFVILDGVRVYRKAMRYYNQRS